MRIETSNIASSHEENQKNAWLRNRWLIALLGMGMLFSGQSYIANPKPSSLPPIPFGVWLNEKMYLADPGIDNVLRGTPLMLLGGIFIAVALRSVNLLPVDRGFSRRGIQRASFFSSIWVLLIAGTGVFTLLLLKITDEKIYQFQTALWVLAIVLFGVVAAIWDKPYWSRFSPNLLRKDWVWLLSIILIGIVIGVYHLQGLPDQLVGDEGNFWTTSRDIATGEFAPSIFANGVYTFPVMSSILQAWVMKIFGMNMWGWRLSSVLFGLATVIPLYFFVREAFNRKIAIISCFVLITNPYFIAFSRLGYNNIQALFFTMLSASWLYIGLSRKSNLYLYLTGVASGLGFYTYFAARFSILLAVIFVLIICVSKRWKFFDCIQMIGIVLFGFMLTVLPLLVYGYISDPVGMSYKALESVFFNTYNGLQFYSKKELFAVAPPFFINDNELFYNPKIYFVLIARGILRTLLVFQKPGIISEHYIASPLAGTMGAVFYVVGLVLTIKKIRQPRNLLLILFFLANILGLSALNTFPPRQTHMVTVAPVLAIFTGLGIYAFSTIVPISLRANLRKLGTPFLIGLAILVGVGGLYDYFITMPKQYTPQWDQIISWAVLDSHGEHVTYVYTDVSQRDFSPYVEVEFQKTNLYNAVLLEDVLSGKKVFSDTPNLIFFPPSISDKMFSVLYEQWGGALIKRTFYNPDGIPVLSVAMNTPFVFARDKTLLEVLRESYQNTILLLLIFFLVGFVSVIVLIPKGWRIKFSAPVNRILEWFSIPGRFERSDEATQDLFEETLQRDQQTFEEDIAEPPIWTQDPIFQTESLKKAGHFKFLLKPIKTDTGTDYYIKLHLPHFPWHIFRFMNIPSAIRFEFHLPSIQIPNPLLLIIAIGFAVYAQILVVNQQASMGVLLYIVSVMGLFFWIYQNPKWTIVFARQLQFSPKAGNILLLLMIAVIIYTRFFDLNYRVYGLEADETKWTVQSWYSTVLYKDIGEFSSMHYKSLPVDFWVRSVFLRIFGMSFLSARIESAVLSIISVIFLYMLARLLTSSPPVAMMSALFFGMSFIELNASHQALHNTPPMSWALASLYFLFIGLRERKLWQFQVTGILLALGMLTYETFYPTVVVTLIYLLGLSTVEVFRRQYALKNWLSILFLILWPVLLVYFVFTKEYISGRQDYLFGTFNGIAGDGIVLSQLLAYFSNNFVELITTTFSQVLWSDSLINWMGPLINPIFLPFVIVGLVYSVWNIRSPHFFFIILWYFSNILLGPILLGSVFPRVIYMAVPPIMIWGALGLWVCFGALRGLFDYQFPHLAKTVFVILILFILANDYHIFTQGLVDPEERQKRREIADLTSASAISDRTIIFPYIPNKNDTIELESHVLLFSVAGVRNLGLDASKYYRVTEYNKLLSTLWEYRDLNGLDVIYDKTSNVLQEEREEYLDAILKCYPGAKLLRTGHFFNVYHFDSRALRQGECYSPPAPISVAPLDSDALSATTPVTFNWDDNGVEPTSFNLIIERKRDDVSWLEIEDVFQGPGWSVLNNFVNDVNGVGFLLDDWQAGEATYTFNVLEDDEYRVWIRLYKRRNNDQHNFIKIGDKTLEFAETGSPLDQWEWKDLGVMNLRKGQLPLALTRTYGQDEQYSVFIDSLVISSDLNFDPRAESLWEPALRTSETPIVGNQYSLTKVLPPGEYRWHIRIFDGDHIVDSTGMRGVESQPAVFRIVP
ncbi:MAG: glycosyltransferase family 39 protein [Anaerolineales bacterium]